ncbi:MAG: amino acid permease [Nanoarchaeota archaeon]
MKHHHKKLTLRRDLNLYQAIACGVGIIVGAGIYVLLGSAAGVAGNAVWISFVISAFLALFTGFSYAELSSIFPKDGSEYVYVEKTFNKKLAFLIGYSTLLGGAISGAAVSLGFSGYFNALFNTSYLVPVAVSLLILMAIINLRGIKESANLNILLTSIEVIGLIFVIAVSLRFFGSVNYFEAPNGIPGILSASSLIFFAYIGFESLVKLSEETKNAKKIIPLALISSIFIATILYILVSLSAVSVLGYQALSESKAPLADVISAAVGEDFSLLLTIIALISTATTTLLIIMAVSRVLYGLGEEIKLLNIFTKVSKKSRSPYLAILTILILALIFVLIGKIETVASITNFTIYLTFFFVNLSLLRLRYQKPKLKRKFKAPLNIKNFSVTAFLGLLSSIFFILNLELKVVLGGIVLILLGLFFGRFVK